MRYFAYILLIMAGAFVLMGCSSDPSAVAERLEAQFIKYGSYTSGTCTYEFKSFRYDKGSVFYNREVVCGSGNPPRRSIFEHNVALRDLDPDAPTGKIDDYGDPMFFAICKRDAMCVEGIERYEHDPRGEEGAVDFSYMTVMFRLSDDIPEKELKALGKEFRHMMELDAEGR